MALFDVTFRELIGEDVARELEYNYGRIGGYVLEEHDDEGGHTDITANTIVVPEITTSEINGPVRINDQVTFDQLIVSKAAVLNPTSLSGNQNNWDPTDANFPLRTLSDVTVLRIDATAARDITGIAAPATVFERVTATPEQQQRLMVLLNRSDYTITLKHNSGSSTSTNRFDCPNQIDYKLLKRGMAWVWYDSSSAVWRIVASEVRAESGTYTPAIDGQTNTSSVGATGVAQYHRTGDVVTVSGSLSVDPDVDNTLTRVGVELPFASTLSSDSYCAGSCGADTGTTETGIVVADTSGNQALLQWVTHNTGNHAMFFHFTYRIV